MSRHAKYFSLYYHFLVDKTAMLTIDWEPEGSVVPEAKKLGHYKNYTLRKIGLSLVGAAGVEPATSSV